MSVFCPGVIRTPILGGGRYGRVKIELPLEKRLEAWERFRPMDPERFASRAIDQVAANREIIVVPSWWKVIWWLNRLSPALGSWLSAVGYRDSLRILESNRDESRRDARP